MRGYVSYVLVFCCSLALLSLLFVSQEAGSYDFSRAIAVERSGALHMNIKECLLESARQGAAAGFESYDVSHDISLCRHCPDNYCAPPTPANPFPPNMCDPLRCGKCFRESEARMAAEDGALGRIGALRAHVFDPDFTIGIGNAAIAASLRREPASPNGFSLGTVFFRDDVGIEAKSTRFRMSCSSRIPKGTVVYDGGTDN